MQICLIFLLLQIRWAELTWCSTRFLLDIAATLPDHLVLQALLATKDPAASLDSLDAPVSLEPQVNLEIKEKEVTSFMNVLDCHTAEREKWVNLGGMDCINYFVDPPWVELQHKCIAYGVYVWFKSALQNVITLCGWHSQLLYFYSFQILEFFSKACFVGANIILTFSCGLCRFARREGRERISWKWYQRTKRPEWATR